MTNMKKLFTPVMLNVSDATNAAGEAIDGYIMGVLMKDGQKVATLDLGTLADGTGTLALPADLDAGDYTVMVTVKDGDMKLTGTDEINFTVEPKAAVVIGDADDYAFDVTGQLEINVTDVAGTPIAGTVTVVIDEGIYKEIEINGNTVIDLTGLDIGAHIVNVVFTAPNYRDSEWVGGFNVTKAAPIISVTGSEVPYGDTSTVDIKVTDQAGNPITGTVIVYASWGVDGAYDVVELAADGTGQAAFRLDLLNGPGTYDVTATYVENDKYTEAVNDTAKAIVADSTKMELEVTVPSDAEFGEDVIITITSTDETGAEVPVEKVNVTINGETQELTVGEDGKVNIGKLPAGETTVTVSVDDGKHSLATETVKVNVEPAGGAIVLAGAEDYPFTGTGNLVINVTDANDQPLNGTITIEIDGEPYKVEAINNGHLEVELKDLEIGAHTAEVIFTNGNYLDSDFIVHFNVTKATPVVSVTGSSVSYGNPSTVGITVTDEAGNPITGTVIVYASWGVDGAYDVVELAADGTGQAVLRLDLLNGVGTYDVTATYLENDKYTEAVNNTEKAIVTDSTELNIEVTANEPIVGQDVIITVTGTDGSGKTVTIDQVEVTIDGTTPQNPLTLDENGQVNLGPLGPGQHDIIVNVVDGTHQPASGEVTVVVKEPTILGTNITVTVTNITYGDSETITFTLEDENGAKLTGKLNVTVGDKPYEVPVDDGVGTLTLPNLAADTYPVVANFAGAGNYGPSTGTGSFNVAQLATHFEFGEMTTVAFNYLIEGRVGEWFNFTLVDANGNPVANKPVGIGNNGKIYNLTTDENGVASLQINLGKENWYTFAMSFIGDENYTAAFDIAKIVVITQNGTLVVPNKSYKATAKTKTLTATFKSSRGSLIPGVRVTFTVNGKTYAAVTDSKGVAKVNVSINKKGTYKVVAKYVGGRTYGPVTKTATLKIT